MNVHDAILASAIGGLKKKPVLIVHLMVSIAFGTLFLLLGKFFVSNVLGYHSYNPNYNLLPILALITMSILVGYYVNFWHNFQEHIREEIPFMLDDALSNYMNFIESIMDKTLYDLIREQIKGISFNKVAMFVLSYYFAWISGLYSTDLMLYIISNHRYTLFGYMLENAYLGFIVFLIGFVLAQFIRPWLKSEEEEKRQPSGEAIANIEYLEGFLERFISFKGLGKAWRYSRTIWGRILINFAENLFALPTLTRSGKLFVFDVFQTPYLKSTGSMNAVKDLPGDVIERMLRKDTVENYRLEPFKNNCNKPPKVEVPLLRRACWYKVYRKKNNEWVRIGYAMLLVVAGQSEEKKLVKEHFDECMKTLRARLRGDKQYCYDVIRELGKMYLEEKDFAIVLLLGNEELLGLRLLLR